jgi:IS4 transposase
MSFDASLIELCATVFDWAKFRTTKGAVKLHLLLDHAGYLPEYAHITNGKVHEVNILKRLQFSPGAIIVIDRGCVDYELFGRWTAEGIYFVTRLKGNASYRVRGRLPLPENRNILKDEIIKFKGFYAKEHCSHPLRRIEVIDNETGDTIVLLTNHMTFGATTVSAIYKDRWQIEIFFKTLKQNLRIKTFVGTSANALKVQIWTALIAILVLKYLKVRSTFGWSMSNLVALLRLNLFTYRDLWEWINKPTESPPVMADIEQLSLRLV